ncbi:MAG: hypothetical protein H7Z38_17040 [Rubrivivax sp.]|nr:hypothetical protein [Pyrinomonadaceae bacterium]
MIFWIIGLAAVTLSACSPHSPAEDMALGRTIFESREADFESAADQLKEHDIHWVNDAFSPAELRMAFGDEMISGDLTPQKEAAYNSVLDFLESAGLGSARFSTFPDRDGVMIERYSFLVTSYGVGGSTEGAVIVKTTATHTDADCEPLRSPEWFVCYLK